jgi:5-formyltetrahydrofolate cyclo-ligase
VSDETIDPAERQMRHRAKAMMRRRMRTLRASMPAEALAARSSKICDQLRALPEIAQARAIALFWPMERHKEVDLRPLYAELAARGTRCAFPAIAPEDGGRMTFRFVAAADELAERGKGFAEPPPDAELVAALDVVIVPGLMFDGAGYRIGYGAGYYDRTLRAFCPPGRAIGVAYDFQLAPEIPALEDDVPVDAIVTDARVLAVR